MTVRPFPLALLATIVVSAGCASAGQADSSWTNTALAGWQLRLERHLSQTRFQNAQWGIEVVSLATGRTLFEHDAHKFFQPGSNAKLFTAALALDRLGPDYCILTPIRASALPDSNGVIHGEVCVEGQGDPTLTAEHHSGGLPMALQPLVSVLTNVGVRRIEGDLVGDDRCLESAQYSAGWTWADLEHGYGSPLSALSFDDNSLALRLTPASEPGAPCELTVLNALPRLDVLNLTVTIRERPKECLSARRPLGTDQVILSGELPVAAQAETLRVPVEDPASYFMESLAASLRRQGIGIDGRVRVGSSLTATHLLGRAESKPVKVMIRRMIKDSHNLTASLLFAHTGLRLPPTERGHSGTAGSRMLNSFLLEAGLPAAEVQIEEGSGLSRNNLITPHALVALLAFMHRHEAARDFFEALPVAGVDGTLKERFVGTPAQGNLRAKTGTLRWAQALSGCLTSPGGEPLAFSILLNRYQPGEHDPSGTEEVDALALLLCEIPPQTNDP